MYATPWLPSILSLAMSCSLPVSSAQQAALPPSHQAVADPEADRMARHASAEWQTLASHLPDPQTATPQSLQLAADVMRARRLQEDALEYYLYALQRGGDEATLENRIGVTELELHHTEQARAAFKRAVQISAKDGRNWNNLGSVEFVDGNLRAALVDYLRAVKLDKKTAVYHSNLGSAYFQLKDFESARKQFETAVKLDSKVFQTGGWAGTEAHVLSLTDRGRFDFEMARIAAKRQDIEAMLHWIAQSSETGFDVHAEMIDDRDLRPFAKDPRVELIIRNARAMRARQVATAASAPALPEIVH